MKISMLLILHLHSCAPDLVMQGERKAGGVGGSGKGRLRSPLDNLLSEDYKNSRDLGHLSCRVDYEKAFENIPLILH